MKIRTLKIMSFALSLFLLCSCAGGNKLTGKQLTFSDLVAIQDASSTSTVKTFMSKKGWTNTTEADLKSRLITSDEISWTLRKDARSPKLATLAYLPADDLFDSEITYQTESKDNYNQMLSEIKTNKKLGYDLCTDKAHAKAGNVHYYDDWMDIYFTPAKTGTTRYEVAFINSDW